MINLLPCEKNGKPIPCGTRVMFRHETTMNTLAVFGKVASVCGNSVLTARYGIRTKKGKPLAFVSSEAILAMEPPTIRGEMIPVLYEWFWRNEEDRRRA